MDQPVPTRKKRHTLLVELAFFALVILIILGIGWYRGFSSRMAETQIEYAATTTASWVIPATSTSEAAAPDTAPQDLDDTVARAPSPVLVPPAAQTSPPPTKPAPAAPASPPPAPETTPPPPPPPAPPPSPSPASSGAVAENADLGFTLRLPSGFSVISALFPSEELMLNKYYCNICSEISFDAYISAHVATLPAGASRASRTTASGDKAAIFRGTIPSKNLDTGTTSHVPWQEVIVELPRARRMYYRAIRFSGGEELPASALDAMVASIRVTAREPLAADETPPYPDYHGGATRWTTYANAAYGFSFVRPANTGVLQYRMTPAAPFEVGFGGLEFTVIATVYPEATTDVAFQNNPDCKVGEMTPVSYQDAGTVTAGAGQYEARHYVATPSAKARCDYYLLNQNGTTYTLEFPLSWQNATAKTELLAAVARVVTSITAPE